MHCPNCGKKISGSAKFCPNCGHVIPSTTQKEKVTEQKEDKKHIDTPANIANTGSESVARLQKIYKDTGNSSIALSIFGFIVTIFASLREFSFIEALLGALIMSPFLAPFFYFGKKLKEDGINNMEHALKISKGMLIYTILFVVVNMLFGGVGFLWLFLLYYYYKSYKETKRSL